MEEAQELSDHIAIMDHGEIIAAGNHRELVRIVGEQHRISLQLNAPAEAVVARWQQTPDVERVTSENGTVTVLARDSNVVLPQLFEIAGSQHVRITNVSIEEPDLESVFLHLTGRALRD
jgi:ABC-2 type transport system ATP-binding protein